MTKSFLKLETFLTVARERSFSKASSKLGISQPATTQKINAIEKYLACKIIERKHNGIVLTPEGKELYKIAISLEKEVNTAEKSILKIINKKLTFRLGSSYIIGTYIIPGNCLNTMSQSIDNDINLTINDSHTIEQKLKDGMLDVGLVESSVKDNDLIYREWLEDEFVLVSNVPIPKVVHTEDLYHYQWILRDQSSHTRRILEEVFDDLGVSCNSFKILSQVSSTIVILQTIKKSKKMKEKPIVSIVSKYAIKDEVNNGELYEARISGYTMKRKFYVAYSKANKLNPYVKSTVEYILSGKY